VNESCLDRECQWCGCCDLGCFLGEQWSTVSGVRNHFSHYKWVVIQKDDWSHGFSGIVDNLYDEVREREEGSQQFQRS
jgi:coenzyme F420-reducing hydrogenase beta subunit